MEGLKQLVSDQEHRQEIVANGLGPYLSCRASVGAICTVLPFIVPFLDFLELSRRLGHRAGGFWSQFYIHQLKFNNIINLLEWFASELPEVNHLLVQMTTLFTVPEIALVLTMVLDPCNLPMAFAAFTLLQSTAKNLRSNLDFISQETGGLASQLSDLRAFFSVSEIKNQVVDGTEKLINSREGICLEFEWVLVATLP